MARADVTRLHAPLEESAGRPGGVLPVLGVALPGHRSFRVWQRHRDVFLRLWRSELAPPIIEPIVMIVALGLGLGTFVELSGDQDYIQFLAPALPAIFPMFGAVFEALWGAYHRLEMQGTYRAILASPARPEDAITGDLLWAATRTTVQALLILGVLLAFTPSYDLVESPLAVLVAPSAFVLGFVFASMGMAYLSVARSISQLTYFFTLAITPMFWFSDAFFPLSDTEPWVRTLAWFLPLTHVVQINRGLMTGDLAWGQLEDVAWLLVFGLGMYWLALRAMRGRLLE